MNFATLIKYFSKVDFYGVYRIPLEANLNSKPSFFEVTLEPKYGSSNIQECSIWFLDEEIAGLHLISHPNQFMVFEGSLVEGNGTILLLYDHTTQEITLVVYPNKSRKSLNLFPKSLEIFLDLMDLNEDQDQGFIEQFTNIN